MIASIIARLFGGNDSGNDDGLAALQALLAERQTNLALTAQYVSPTVNTQGEPTAVFPCTLYHDGAEAGRETIGSGTVDIGAMTFGTQTGNTAHTPNGHIYAIKMWDAAITSPAPGQTLTSQPADLIGYWPLDLNRNGVTPDLSPYSNHGTVNGPTLTGPTVELKDTLSGTATSDTVTGLLNGEEYEAYVHTLTSDNEVRDV